MHELKTVLNVQKSRLWARANLKLSTNFKSAYLARTKEVKKIAILLFSRLELGWAEDKRTALSRLLSILKKYFKSKVHYFKKNNNETTSLFFTVNLLSLHFKLCRQHYFVYR